MERYKMRMCKECGGLPILCQEGMARSALIDGEWDMYFTDWDGYIVKCSECGEEVSGYYSHEDDAISAWNVRN